MLAFSGSAVVVVALPGAKTFNVRMTAKAANKDELELPHAEPVLQVRHRIRVGDEQRPQWEVRFAQAYHISDKGDSIRRARFLFFYLSTLDSARVLSREAAIA